jgi:ubiquinone/menaquinone biosynthesis C-methylase UbiE
MTSRLRKKGSGGRWISQYLAMAWSWYQHMVYPKTQKILPPQPAKAMTDNIAGHRAKYELLAAHHPAAEAGTLYVGGSDPILTGFYELEAMRIFAQLDGASVVDIGCGIGRLTRHLLLEKIDTYVGLDIIPEILQPAIDMSAGDPRFSFDLAQDCKIPCVDESATLVVAFSVLTHLLDEEIYDYFVETRRVLKPEGAAIFSFFDFNNSVHQEMFFKHAAQHRAGHGDILKFTTKDVLSIFAARSKFNQVEFIEGQHDIPLTKLPSTLLDVTRMAPTFNFTQSLCILRV